MKFYYDKESGMVFASPNCVEDCFHNILEYCIIYEDFQSVEGLNNIIDNIVDLSQDARQFISEGKMTRDDPDVKKEETETYELAHREEQTDINSGRWRKNKENKNENLGG